MAAIKSACSSDVVKIAALEAQLFSDAWSENMITDCLSKAYYRVLICENESGTMLGYLISTHIAGESELLRIGVDPAFRGFGYGKQLMRAFVRECEAGECTEAFLEVRASNVPAIRLYEKFGFSAIGKRKNYYHDPEEDACLMAGSLTELSTPKTVDCPV